MPRLHSRRVTLLATALCCLTATGCQSPYHSDRGALFGGVTGAGVGALVGNAVGNTAAGALIGGGVGAVTGAAIGQGMDEVEARNRAAIAAHMGRPVNQGATSIEDVIAMQRAGVAEELISGHVRYNGMARPLTPQDLITLQSSGVPVSVIQTMQSPPQPPVQRAAATTPVLVEERVYGAPVYPYPVYYPPPSVGWGFSVCN
jgi:hypothetical protein